MNEESKDLEKQRLQFEKEKLEFERQKFEAQKEKHNNPIQKKSSSTKTSAGDIVGYIFSIVLIISAFLPWVSVSSGGGGFSFSSSVNGLETGHGFIVILCAVAAIILIALKKTWALIPIGIALLDAIAVIAGVGSVSASAGGSAAKAGFAIGPVIVFIASAVIIVSTLLRDKRAGKRSFDYKAFFIKNKFNILLGAFLLFLFIPILSEDYSLDNFKELMLALFFGVAIPSFILYYLKLKKSFIAFLPLGLFYILGYILSYANYGDYLWELWDYGDMSSNTFFALMAFSTNVLWFNIIFYLILIIVLVQEVWAMKGATLIPEPIIKYLKYINPKIYYPFLFVPFVFLAIYNITTKHITSSEENEAFYDVAGKMEGQWHLINDDSTDVFIFNLEASRISPDYYTNEPEYTGELGISYRYTLKHFDDKIKEGEFEYIAQYDELLSFPFVINKTITVLNFDKRSMVIEAKMPGLKKQKYNCVRDYLTIRDIFDKKQARLQAVQDEIRKQEIIEQSIGLTEEFYEPNTLAVALKKRVYFYENTSLNSKTSSFIIEGQSANALQRSGDFVKVFFEYKGRQTSGYFLINEIEIVTESDLYDY